VPFLWKQKGDYHPEWMGSVDNGKMINGDERHQALWFRGDGIPEGRWVGASLPTYCTGGDDDVEGESDSEAGKMMWVLCMGGAEDERKTKSTLRSFFHSPDLSDPNILREIISYICPHRNDFTPAIRDDHDRNIQNMISEDRYRTFVTGHPPRYRLRGPLPVKQKVCLLFIIVYMWCILYTFLFSLPHNLLYLKIHSIIYLPFCSNVDKLCIHILSMMHFLSAIFYYANTYNTNNV
jgi:hypothetical protein